MAYIDITYHHLLERILGEGFKYEDPNRKGVNRIQIPSYIFEHNFKNGFPAITTKQLYWKGVVGELLWILRGDSNIKYLLKNGISIWNKDAYNWYKRQPNLYDTMSFKEYIQRGGGDLGRIYPEQLRKWTGIQESTSGTMRSIGYEETYGVDQFSDLIETLRTNPLATKKTVTYWNPAEKDQCALTPCHWAWEILVEPMSLEERILYFRNSHDDEPLKIFIDLSNYDHDYFDEFNWPKYKFTLKWHQHSVDTFLGLPFNIASYALLAQIIGKIVNMVPKGIIGDLSNVHIYEPHLDAVKKQLDNDTDMYNNKSFIHLPHLNQWYEDFNFDVNKIIDNLRIDDCTLVDYESYPRIPAEMLPYDK